MTTSNRGRYLDYWARCETGPICFKKQFDTDVYWKNLTEITKKYNIVYDPNTPVPVDDEVLDRLWNAAVEFVLACGVLCVDTERLIKFTEDEIIEGLANLPTEVVWGEDKDSITIKHRGFEDYDSGKNPVFTVGRLSGPVSQDVYDAVCLGYAKEPLIDIVQFQGAVAEIMGVPIKPSSPFEMLAEMQRTAIVKDVLRRAGRPGFPDQGSTPVTLRAEMCALMAGMRRGDARHAYIMPHMCTDYDQMCRALVWHTAGCSVWSIGEAFIGSIPGGPATSAVNCLAELIVITLLYEPENLGVWADDGLYFSNSSRQALFVNNYAAAAYMKHTCAPSLWGGVAIATAKITSKEYFWEFAAGAISSTVLGLGANGGSGAQSAQVNHVSPLGARFAAEVGRAVGKAKLTRRQANEFLNQIIPKYQPYIDNRTLHTIGGGSFAEAYDLVRVEPKEEYLKIYQEVKDELKQMGLAI
jgi:methylamine--corrinoid protein Co-methyltransferase